LQPLHRGWRWLFGARHSVERVQADVRLGWERLDCASVPDLLAQSSGRAPPWVGRGLTALDVSRGVVTGIVTPAHKPLIHKASSEQPRSASLSQGSRSALVP